MLKPIADGVLIHQSRFMQSNAVVVQGRDGALLIDPGVHDDEMACLAGDLQELGLPVVAGFSTHPHWDHLLWDTRLGTAPRFGTARGSESAQHQLAGGVDRIARAAGIPDQVALDLLGLITGLPAQAAQIPWDGPQVRLVEHAAHAPGHAALVIREQGVLVAGDMVSDLLIPLLDFNDTGDPIADYLAGLELLEGVTADVDVFVPGHGSIGGRDQLQARIDLDRAYVQALRDAGALSDPRLDPSADSSDWLPGVHARQLQRLAERTERGTPD